LEYDTLRAISGTVGLIIFVSLFAGVLIYALWPKNRKKFDHASRIPLNDDRNDSDLSRGGCRG